MKVLITGGAGYIGSELLYGLSKNTSIEEIVLYDNFSKANYNLFVGLRKLPAKKIKVVEADILDSRTLQKSLQGIDVVYHLAALVKTPFTDVNPHYFEQINNWGTAQLVDAIEQSSSVKKLINVSSVSVYGANSSVRDEHEVPQPKTAYGISKLRGEKHLIRLKNKIEIYNLRFGNVFGYSKNLRIDAVVNKMMFNAHFHRLVQIHGNGEQKRAFLNMESAIAVLEYFIENSLPSETYNVVEYNYSINEVVEHIRSLYPGLEFIYVNQDVVMRSLEVKASERIIPIFPALTFEEALNKFKQMFTF
jgi:UDP-glucose 4-epimerase